MKNFINLENKIGYHFKNELLLQQALTHSSAKADSQKSIKDNERLEFLGDSVLNLAITNFLFRHFQNDKEGSLAKKRAALICSQTLAEMANEINLAEFLILGKSEQKDGGLQNANNLENAMEALIGAIYLDSNFSEAEKFVEKFWFEKAKIMQTAPQDPKAALQEHFQKHYKSQPTYEVLSVSGPSHKPVFEIEVRVEGKNGSLSKCQAIGANKKQAEKKAAEKLLNQIHIEERSDK